MKFEFLIVLILFQVSCTKKMAVTEDDFEAYKSKYIHDLTVQDPPVVKLSDTHKIEFYPYNESYRCRCSFSKLEKSEEIILNTSSGKQKNYIPYGIVKCQIKREEIKLFVYTVSRFINNPLYKDYLFLPYKDETNGEETYGGGRYIDINKSDISDNQIIIDFNKSYNPYCAYMDGYNCPIPPRENSLATKIEAGEKAFEH